MNKSLLFLGATVGLLCASGSVYAGANRPSKVRQALAAANRKAASMSAESAARFYHPGTITSESFDVDGNSWRDPYTVKYTYNEAGQVLTETNGDGEVKNTYDNTGRLIKRESYSLVEGKKVLTYAAEYTYDSVVTDLVIKETSTSYNYMTGEVESSSISGVEITRNSDGNITKIQDYGKWGDEEIRYSGYSLVMEYGEDKKAVKITEYYDDEVETVFSDIVWATTDGQITTFEFDDPNSDMYFSNNRIASATITDNDYPGPAKFTATYDGDSYHSLIMVGEERALEIDFKCIEKFAPREDFEDQYSYDCTSFEAEYEYEEDTDSYYVESTRNEIEVNRADAFGINIYNKTTREYKYPSPQHQYDDEISVEEEKYEVVYDEAIGYPISAVHYYSEDGSEFEPRSRYTYSDYENVDPAGVTAPSAVASEDAEYFTMQGVRVIGQPAPGLYICRKGGETSKVVIR